MSDDKPTTTHELREAARGLTDLALRTLETIMTGQGGETAKLAAAREVLDRGHGKARAGAEAHDENIRVVVRRFGDDGEDQ